MSGHTNRNKRNGGNPKSRHGPPRQRGQENRPSQPKNAGPPASARPPQANEKSSELKAEPKPEPKAEPKPQEEYQEEYREPRHERQPSGQTTNNQSEGSDDATRPEQPQVVSDVPARDERPIPAEPPENAHPRGRAPFAAASRGGHAYIPANGSRQGMNGQNGHHHGNGFTPNERRADPASAMNDYDGGESDGVGTIPATWRIERLNGGTDSTPREPFRPESRGEVGSLIDSLHELFSQDRAAASQGDSARCGICYLHFPLTALEYREAEGFYVCATCKRALGHNPLMMIRRQQPPHSG